MCKQKQKKEIETITEDKITPKVKKRKILRCVSTIVGIFGIEWHYNMKQTGNNFLFGWCNEKKPYR